MSSYPRAVSPKLPTTYYEHLPPTNWTRALFPPFVSQIIPPPRQPSFHFPPLLRRNETVGKCCQVTGSQLRRRRRRRFMGAIIQTHLWLGWKEEGPAGSTWIVGRRRRGGGSSNFFRSLFLLWWSGDSVESVFITVRHSSPDAAYLAHSNYSSIKTAASKSEQKR